MKTLKVKMNNKVKFERSMKELKALKVWGIGLAYDGEKKFWTVSYETEEQEQKINRVVGWCWDKIEITEDFSI